ncbi:MAG: hypothetical protein P1U68_10420 [Verrucomicrobiales bacterium]|nr:hypothetical protein [Verrucomicrobiales bacterium]
MGERYIKGRKSVRVEKYLVNLLCRAGSIEKARTRLEALKGGLSLRQYFELKSEILEFEGRFADAIDAIYSIPDRLEFTEDYTTHLTYLYMKSEQFEKAFEISSSFLKDRNYNPNYRADIINREFSKKKLGRNPKVQNLNRIVENSASDPDCRAGALLVLGEHDQAYEIFRSESDNDFSKLEGYLRWPIAQVISDKLAALRDSLTSSKRTLDELVSIESGSKISGSGDIS